MKKLQVILKQTVMLIILGMLVSPGLYAEVMVKKIVLFHENVTAEEIDSYITAWEAQGAVLVDRVGLINGIILNVPETVASADLANDARVAGVEDDQQMELQALVASADGGAADGGAADGGASEPVRFIEALEGNPLLGNQIPWGIIHLYEQPYDPYALTTQFKSSSTPDLVDEARTWEIIKDIKVAIFDTGVDFNHPKLKKLVKESVDFVNMTFCTPDDDNGHGTHVAATLVGYKLGLARGCLLYSAKVLNQNAMGEVSTLVRALQWAIDRKVHVINMSIAFREDNLAVRMAVRKAYEAGIIMVAATGNHSNWENDIVISADGGAADGGAADGGAASDESTANPYPVMYPAAYPEVIAVAAHDAFGEFAAFSNTGPETDLLAPGKDILSANLTAVSQYGVCSGTSMATPHVTATVALMLALDAKHTMPLKEVREVLTDTAVNGKLNLVGALDEVVYRNTRFDTVYGEATWCLKDTDGNVICWTW